MEKLLKDMRRNAAPYHPNVDLESKNYYELLSWVHPIERPVFKERFEKLNREETS
jgi:hypothetical protein